MSAIGTKCECRLAALTLLSDEHRTRAAETFGEYQP